LLNYEEQWRCRRRPPCRRIASRQSPAVRSRQSDASRVGLRPIGLGPKPVGGPRRCGSHAEESSRLPAGFPPGLQLQRYTAGSMTSRSSLRRIESCRRSVSPRGPMPVCTVREVRGACHTKSRTFLQVRPDRGLPTMDGSRKRRMRDRARKAWYAHHRQLRFARWLGFPQSGAKDLRGPHRDPDPMEPPFVARRVLSVSTMLIPAAF